MTTTIQLEAARQQISEALRLLGDGITAALDAVGAAPLVAREAEEPLTVGEAAALLRIHPSSVYRWIKKHPECRRRVGSELRIERGALLRATKRG
jgi:excisionase family DNA binding protein